MTGGLSRRIRAFWPLALTLIASAPATAQDWSRWRDRDRHDDRYYNDDSDSDDDRYNGNNRYYQQEDKPRGAALMRSTLLAAHNRERRDAGVPPLVWNTSLAAEAQAYARTLARERIFRHSDKATRAGPEGENLWMGSTRAYSYEFMVGSWIDEQRYYRPRAVLPNFSSTGRWQDVGHYTQMIWRGTTAVGCGLASNADNDYLVCRYSPPGNVYGRNATAMADGSP